MTSPDDLAVWKRVLGVIACAGFIIWILAAAFHAASLDCTPATRTSTCAYQSSRLSITTDDLTFEAPTADRVRVIKSGKRNLQGELEIHTDLGRTVGLTWMSADEAEAAAASLVAQTAANRPFHLETHGPRWWLLLLLFFVPLGISFIRTPKLRPPPAPYVDEPLRDKKQTRAERKRREHEQRK